MNRNNDINNIIWLKIVSDAVNMYGSEMVKCTTILFPVPENEVLLKIIPFSVQNEGLDTKNDLC